MMKTWMVLGLVLWMSLGGRVGLSGAGGTASIGESGEFLELSHDADGRAVVDRLPLYHVGGVRYFSAGVGKEERAAEYPSFSLKIVFTAGGKPYLAGVSVTIHPAQGGPALAISSEQVSGPWLFVDLPTGVYDVIATHGTEVQTLKGIKLESGKPRTVHLRWAEERGLPASLPKE